MSQTICPIKQEVDRAFGEESAVKAAHTVQTVASRATDEQLRERAQKAIAACVPTSI